MCVCVCVCVCVYGKFAWKWWRSKAGLSYWIRCQQSKQGGSVMCVRTKCSDPAHPRFWHNCVPYEHIEKPLKKIVYEQKDRLQRKQLCGVKKCHIRLMRSAIIKKASQDEQQNQTTTTLINYILNYVHFKKT